MHKNYDAISNVILVKDLCRQVKLDRMKINHSYMHHYHGFQIFNCLFLLSALILLQKQDLNIDTYMMKEKNVSILFFEFQFLNFFCTQDI